MDIFLYIVVACLFILVCALIHELLKAKDDIADLEYETTAMKLEYRKEIKALKEEKLIFNNYKTLLNNRQIYIPCKAGDVLRIKGLNEKDFNMRIAKCVEDIKNV